LAHDHLTYDDLLRIVELIKTSEQFSEFRLKIGEIEVELRRRDASAPAAAPPREPIATVPSAPAAVAATARAEPASAAIEQAAPVQWPEHFGIVRSPMVGTFYRAPEPGAAPFVQIGDAVEPDTVVCIIEVMKLMNSIPAGARGTVRHILIEDAQAVEAQQPLIVIEPAS